MTSSGGQQQLRLGRLRLTFLTDGLLVDLGQLQQPLRDNLADSGVEALDAGYFGLSPYRSVRVSMLIQWVVLKVFAHLASSPRSGKTGPGYKTGIVFHVDRMRGHYKYCEEEGGRE